MVQRATYESTEKKKIFLFLLRCVSRALGHKLQQAPSITPVLQIGGVELSLAT